MDPIMKLLEDDEVPRPPRASLAILLGLLGVEAEDLVAAVPISLFELRRTRACTRAPTSRPSRRRSTARWRPAPAAAPPPPSVPRPLPPRRPSLRITAPVSTRPNCPFRIVCFFSLDRIRGAPCFWREPGGFVGIKKQHGWCWIMRLLVWGKDDLDKRFCPW